jgi:hypothetical protein
MFDHVIVLDEILRCPHGHGLGGLQTKDFDDPSMDTYLLEGPWVYRATRGGFAGSDEAAEYWRLEGAEAVFQRRYGAERILPPREVVIYTSCHACKPVLSRHDRPTSWRDLIGEHQLWVEFRLTFEPGGPRLIERTSGTREDLASELREEGLRVLRDDEPLAMAHHEIRTARNDALPRRRRGRR